MIHGWVDGRTDGQTDRLTDGRMDRYCAVELVRQLIRHFIKSNEIEIFEYKFVIKRLEGMLNGFALRLEETVNSANYSETYAAPRLTSHFFDCPLIFIYHFIAIPTV